MTNQNVVIARYINMYGDELEYIVDEEGKVNTFFNKESAEKYLTEVCEIPKEQLDWFLYLQVFQCLKCNSPMIEKSGLYLKTDDSVICYQCLAKQALK